MQHQPQRGGVAESEASVPEQQWFDARHPDGGRYKRSGAKRPSPQQAARGEQAPHHRRSHDAGIAAHQHRVRCDEPDGENPRRAVWYQPPQPGEQQGDDDTDVQARDSN